jgi:molybdate transport system substrate-binding protein
LGILGQLAAPAFAGQVHVAVAANFAEPLKQLAIDFEKTSGHTLTMSAGSTGKLYAQIRHGAPMDVFLSADEATALRLEQDGLAVPGTRFTYAIGRLILWSAAPDGVDPLGRVLHSGQFRTLAIAAPKLAPYGAAAIETLDKLGLRNATAKKLVYGESIGQVYGFVASGNAELGFVALSQVWTQGRLRNGSGWLVPTHMHRPLRQDAQLLSHGRDNPAASALLTFLKTDKARLVIRQFGYDIAP